MTYETRMKTYAYSSIKSASVGIALAILCALLVAWGYNKATTQAQAMIEQSPNMEPQVVITEMVQSASSTIGDEVPKGAPGEVIVGEVATGPVHVSSGPTCYPLCAAKFHGLLYIAVFDEKKEVVGWEIVQ